MGTAGKDKDSFYQSHSHSRSAPLFGLDSRYRMTVVGLVSFGASLCGSGIPGVFTRVEPYIEWILRTIK